MYVLNTCAATLIFMKECDVPGVRWLCSYAICKHIKIWLCKQIFKCENFLHILPVFRPLSLPKETFRESKISNLKLAWEEEVKVLSKCWMKFFIAKVAMKIINNKL